ncbi:hypothetical protein NPIL_228691 [Nephila pilipes]|uniref:Uncharacterized protein n=1 Tax=Nephila pilipes TaxID=299642 RepID=A0A8X6QEB3_NEPPI|nr:hypothetical protein NPIL_361561 [Nephila pilipes]GFU14443.1 hypothetical protein NPIL_228691 [Nephila pilipes]
MSGTRAKSFSSFLHPLAGEALCNPSEKGTRYRTIFVRTVVLSSRGCLHPPFCEVDEFIALQAAVPKEPETDSHRIRVKSIPNPISRPLADDFLKLFLYPFFGRDDNCHVRQQHPASVSYGCFFPRLGALREVKIANGVSSSSEVDNVQTILGWEKTESMGRGASL